MLEALKAVESEITRLERISKQAFSIDEVHPAVGRVADATRAAIAAAEGGATKHVHSFSIWHDRQDRPARGYSRCACGVEPGDDWAEAK